MPDLHPVGFLKRLDRHPVRSPDITRQTQDAGDKKPHLFRNKWGGCQRDKREGLIVLGFAVFMVIFVGCIAVVDIVFEHGAGHRINTDFMDALLGLDIE